ncbi:phosphatidylinositol N-acetylglucosaminyltransferase subunit Q [Biomphalaria pfeifferi]|uniref:Phosphatidylinositol N-acetylglucosaminyltransferase subunit Q n=1 Tax=Biomphalaria pfeifferi TaxID=112525 RepID=A0AAD8F2E7_BIOPF|nr:phosphatidylinositol N-acetylglucosaminyltransferase subunit Q [Biomphalaria pfeifferi]
MRLVAWNAFIPIQVKQVTESANSSVSTWYLKGTIDYASYFICVHGMRKQSKDIKDKDHSCIGIWQRTKDAEFKRISSQSMLLICVKKTKNVKVTDSFQAVFYNQSLEAHPVTCIFHEPKELTISYILLKSLRLDTDKKRICDKAEKNALGYFESIKEAPYENCITALIKNISSGCLLPTTQEQVDKLFIKASARAKSEAVLNALCVALPLFLMYFICFFGKLIYCGSKIIHSNCPWLSKIMQLPNILHHFQSKAFQYQKVLKLSQKDPFNRFILYNCCCQQFVDTCLGLSMIYLITQTGQAEYIASCIENWADNAAHNLTVLVKWLMGAPAGLKLNAQLTKFFGHFFIYHIYLWSGYLSYLKLVMSSVIWYSSFVGVLGVSAQLCLIQDVLSMLTLHIYCFYVYAARIFSVQVYAICSLWRLFLGKKWNVLRSRVDSALYNTDQLFVGNLIFTVLLFLLPTTALYYVVFTAFRLLVLIAKGFLHRIVYVINVTPVFTVIVKVLAPKWLVGSVRFEIQNETDCCKTLVLAMETCQISVRKLFSFTSSWMCSPPPPTYTWRECLYYLATGQLIYPWLHHDNDKKCA